MRRLGLLYDGWLRRAPVLTKSVTSAVLFGFGDRIAQRIEKSRSSKDQISDQQETEDDAVLVSASGGGQEDASGHVRARADHQHALLHDEANDGGKVAQRRCELRRGSATANAQGQLYHLASGQHRQLRLRASAVPHPLHQLREPRLDDGALDHFKSANVGTITASQGDEQGRARKRRRSNVNGDKDEFSLPEVPVETVRFHDACK
ncbi:unnamed protein product [Phytophthora fragariaefolia]|uniref:Unnamed protein product n=1 Tax=Phytophthora fragariaefolia TaxID=1490495 RepID=A0A9W6X3W6_9STRA|nr:unnamed protein product [Phytophthora fragariaefolia]